MEPEFEKEDRFARQTRFAALGQGGQDALGRSSVLLVGCGALGGVLAQWLVRAGIGRIVIVDRDIVEETNLPRQVLFTAEHARAGAPKALAAREVLAQVEGPTSIEAHAAHLDADLLLRLGASVDLILDGTDNMATRYLINDFSVARDIPWIYGGVVSSGGLILPVLAGRGPCLRCIFRDPPPPGMLPTCDTAGVIGPAVGVIASMQAGLALRILSGNSAGLEPALLELDAWSGTVRRLTVPRADDCPTCGLRTFEFLDSSGSRTDAVSLCGRNTVQVMPQREREPGSDPSLDAVEVQLRDAGLVVRRLGPLLRFEADGHRFTHFQDGRTLVEGTEDTGRALSLVARWIGA
ncbi:Molybdopterin-synthase adenylyltransferase [Planctomycetes bacterium Poly30]|uniref:Molybdopterin-synthase adenylyltransferase n=1 Tax=Saltatorellus ferox TaxID=2528018 RepID=A0A518EU50_9BACT|nr:Molybdopterin-synthase adenylyltransferase [Planctomycetes bacterium Poly30]